MCPPVTCLLFDESDKSFPVYTKVVFGTLLQQLIVALEEGSGTIDSF